MNSAALRIPDLTSKKAKGEKIGMLTCYDATMARLLDRAGIDALLVGDSLGMVISGQQTTLGVTMDVMIHHTKAVRAGTKRAVVISDMPFLSYHTGVDEAVRNAGRLVQEGGALAVKLEGGKPVAATIRRIIAAGIPVMGHLGLTPQSVNTLGGFRRVGVNEQEREQLIEDAQILQDAGVFAIVLECIPHDLAAQITKSLVIPTIGIGAGPHCDGQVLVSYDALGMFDEFVPSFVKQYVKLAEAIEQGASAYLEEVRSGKFRG